MRYAKSVMITLLAKGLALPIGVAASIITARALGPQGRGVLAILIFFQGLTVTFGMMGLNGSITYFMGKNPERSPGIAGNAFSLAIAGGVTVAVLLWGLATVAPALILGGIDIRFLEIFLLSVPFTFLSQFLQNVLLGKQKFIAYNVLDLIVRFLQMTLFGVILYGLGGGTLEAVWVFTGVSIVGGILYTAVARKTQPFALSFDLPLFREMLRYGGGVYAASLLLFLVIRVHLMMINIYLGEAAAGVYSVALQIVDIVYIVPATFGLVLLPKVSAGEDPSSALTLRVFRLSFVGMIVVCGAIAGFSEPIILLLFGEEFREAARVLALMSPGVVALSLATILNADLVGRGRLTPAIVAPFVSVVLMIPALHLTLASYGLQASAIIASSGYFIMAAILLVNIKSQLRCGWSSFFVLKVSDLRVGGF